MSGFHRRRHWFAVFSLSLTLVGCGVQDEISRAIDAFNRAVDALKQESSDWRTEARRSLEAIDGARTETLQQIHRDLSELVSFSTAKVASTGDCTVQYYKSQLSNTLTDYISFLKSGGKTVPSRRLLACGTDPKQISFQVGVAPDLITIFGFGFRSLQGGAMNAEDAFWLQLENEDGSREDVRRPGLIAISDPYNLRVNLSGFVAKASARTLRIVTRYGAETVAIGGVPIISSRTLPVEIFTEVSPSDAHPEAVAKVPTDFTLIGGGCESGFADNNPAHLMTWSYPAKSKDSKTGADEWRCGSRQHVVPAPGTVRAYAIALPKGTLSGEDVKILATQGSPSNRPTAVARLEPPYVLIGGGCLTSSTGSLLDFGPVIAASYPSDSRSWTCQGKTAHRQGQGQELPGPITAFAVGIKTLSLQRLEPSLTTQSADASEHPYATSSLVDKDLLEKQQRKVPENAALVGGGCWFSDEAAAGVYLVKAFPVEGLGSRRGWRCVFGSHALSGTAKANAVSIAMVPVLTLSAR